MKLVAFTAISSPATSLQLVLFILKVEEKVPLHHSMEASRVQKHRFDLLRQHILPFPALLLNNTRHNQQSFFYFIFFYDFLLVAQAAGGQTPPP